MNLDAMVEAMTPEIYAKLCEAVETGKWLDGTPMNEQQQQSSIQAVMLYQAKMLESEQHMTVGGDGQIVHKSRQQLKQEFSQPSTIARFTQDDI